MITDYDAHVIAYSNYLWREYLEWKLAQDNHKFWSSENVNTYH